ncbi:undecaprenyldiphospho-muramoylpentapeptide beta-N-acetylglucosaminyltransferase [Myxococcota bacterium]|nr:undecaprenyldiphospho-muramoylpentapeptide beta-N-acetylglucosaminyltransferase [Myxococcota bacterium]
MGDRDGLKLALVGGGTGGHVFPAVAIAEAFLKRVEGGEVVFIGNPDGLEARVAAARGFPFEGVATRRLKNAGAVERLGSLARMPGALLDARRALRRHQPDIVLGVGGYVSGPVVLTAALLGLPTAVAEQNARAGLTNRVLSRFVQRVYVAFPEAEAQMPASKARLLGNPIRADLIQIAAHAAPPGQGRRVLILGGSQGALALNERLPPVLAALRARLPDLEVCHQAGAGKDAPVRAAYDAAGFEAAEVTAFIDDVAAAMAAADLVIARAGATTVAELACMGRGAFFIPFPHAADDHQAANAAALVDAGAALMRRQEALSHEGLVAEIGDLLADPRRLAQMGERARAWGRPLAGDHIVDDLLNLWELRR